MVKDEKGNDFMRDGEAVWKYISPDFRTALLAIAPSSDKRRIDPDDLGTWLRQRTGRFTTLDMPGYVPEGRAKEYAFRHALRSGTAGSSVER